MLHRCRYRCTDRSMHAALLLFILVQHLLSSRYIKLTNIAVSGSHPSIPCSKRVPEESVALASPSPPQGRRTERYSFASLHHWNLNSHLHQEIDTRPTACCRQPHLPPPHRLRVPSNVSGHRCPTFKTTTSISSTLNRPSTCRIPRAAMTRLMAAR